MKYLETKHQRNSARITALIVIILVLLLFVVGAPYLDPPEEYGVAVNFGNSDVGSGKVQPLKPVKSEPNPQTQTTKSKESEVEETTPIKSSLPSEKVITADNEADIALKKQKEQAEAKKRAETEAKAEAERIEREKKAAEERKRKAEEAKKKKLDALIGGVKSSEGKTNGGQGPDDGPGDKGQLDGNPYAPSYFGGSGPGKGGVGSGLGGRGGATKKIYKQDCNETGLVVVRIVVNQSGNVIDAQPGIKGTTNTNPCLLEPAKKIALSHKWPADANAPKRQIGFVSINFDVSQ
ncbi:MAG: energy transducer TonB [Bacteroidota bacterium]